MTTDIVDAIELLKKRSLELAYLHTLLYILEADIDVRRALEAVQRVPFLEKHSVRVEHSREAVQEQIQQVEAEIGTFGDLLMRMARNEVKQ
ncbi:MAG: hypothetical protein KDD92_00180 [Caldilineaceae bacterium]|nr:hypothetical protein [Caldilineaceae bacterium]